VKKIGVLALQGDFREHRLALERLGCVVQEVRLPRELAGLSGVIFPGGESTTIGKLMVAYGLDAALKDFHVRGRDSAGHGYRWFGSTAFGFARDDGFQECLRAASGQLRDGS
jgi:SNO glutamine amidotransferase family